MSLVPINVRKARIRLRHLTSRLDRFLERRRCNLVPAPGVLERLDLRRRPRAVFCEQDVVVLVRLERRIEVDEIDGLVLDVPSQHVEVVAVVQEVRLHRAEV
jgi:hypothetical protein